MCNMWSPCYDNPLLLLLIAFIRSLLLILCASCDCNHNMFSYLRCLSLHANISLNKISLTLQNKPLLCKNMNIALLVAKKPTPLCAENILMLFDPTPIFIEAKKIETRKSLGGNKERKMILGKKQDNFIPWWTRSSFLGTKFILKLKPLQQTTKLSGPLEPILHCFEHSLQ